MDRSPTKFYRFTDLLFSDGVRIHKEEFNLVKETPCGYWIEPVDRWFMNPLDQPDRIWVSKTARKRFAYPSEEMALESFIARKKEQIRILKEQVNRAQSAFQKGLDLLKKEMQSL